MAGGGPFVVNVAVLLRRAGSRRDEHRSAPLPGLAVTGSRVPDGSDVAVDVVLESLGGSTVVANGSVSADWEASCRRCLGPASGAVHVDVRELFERGADGEETYPLRGDQLDLEPLARDAVLLALPLAPVCADSCAGLCPTCGVNRNEVTCTCETDERDPRWAALDDLRET